MSDLIKRVQCVDITDIPDEIRSSMEDDHDISTHCATELYQIDDEGTPFTEWLKENGFVFDKQVT